jgi:hypothetical protein
VVGLEGLAVGTAEGVRELCGGVVDVVTEGLGGKVETTVEETCYSTVHVDMRYETCSSCILHRT